MTCLTEAEALEQANAIVDLHGRGEAIVHITTTQEDVHPESILSVTPKLVGVTIPGWDLQTLEGVIHSTSAVQLPMLLRKLYAAGFQVTKLERVGERVSRRKRGLVDIDEVVPLTFDLDVWRGDRITVLPDIHVPNFGNFGATHRAPRLPRTGELELGTLVNNEHPYHAYAADVFALSRWPEHRPERDLAAELRAAAETVRRLQLGGGGTRAILGDPDNVTVFREMRARNNPRRIVEIGAHYDTGLRTDGNLIAGAGGNHELPHTREALLRTPDPADLDAAVRRAARERHLQLNFGREVRGVLGNIGAMLALEQVRQAENPPSRIRRLGQKIRRRLRNLRNRRDET